MSDFLHLWKAILCPKYDKLLQIIFLYYSTAISGISDLLVVEIPTLFMHFSYFQVKVKHNLEMLLILMCNMFTAII